MHNRVYQITTEPVPEDERLSECFFYEHWFLDSIADFVSDELNRDYELECFKDALEQNKIAVFHSPDSFSILPGGKERHFAYAYEQFHKAVVEAATMSLDDFINDERCGELVYTIKSRHCDHLAAYVYSEKLDMVPLDTFIRLATVGEHYYIGGVIDYHC